MPDDELHAYRQYIVGYLKKNKHAYTPGSIAVASTHVYPTSVLPCLLAVMCSLNKGNTEVQEERGLVGHCYVALPAAVVDLQHHP